MMRIILLIVMVCVLPVPSKQACAQQVSDSGKAAARTGGQDQDREASASGGRGRPPAIHYEPHTFALRHADCCEVASMLSRTFRGTTAYPIERTNTVIYAGPPDTIEAVCSLITSVDIPPTETQVSDLHIVQVSNRDAERLAHQLAMAVRSRDLQVAADDATSTILLNGPSYLVESAKSILTQLDKTAGTVNLEFALFHADRNAKRPLGDIPDDLAEVARELERFGELELLGRLSAVAVEDDEFMVRGSISENVNAQVAGRVVSAPPDGAVKLILEAEMLIQREDPTPSDSDKGSARRSRMPEFEVATAVVARVGDYVVLGSAPAGWQPGESAILVLHVRP
jgi:hypothetical protein